MVDHIYDRGYDRVHRQANANLANSASFLFRQIRNAFVVLQRIEYSAPWTQPPGIGRCR